jgi:hypothetical protein
MISNNLGYNGASSVQNTHNTFDNINDDDLDQLARSVNNDIKNKKRNKQKRFKLYGTYEDMHTSGNEAFIDMMQNDYDVAVEENAQGYYNAQGDYINDSFANNTNSTNNASGIKGTSVRDILNSRNTTIYDESLSLMSDKTMDDKSISLNIFNDKQYKYKKNKISNDSEISDSEFSDISNISNLSNIDNNNVYIDSDSNSDYNLSDEEIELELRSNSNYVSERSSDNTNVMHRNCVDYDIHSVDTLNSLTSGESLIEHIGYCETCRKKVIDLIQKNKIKKQKRKRKKREKYRKKNKDLVQLNYDDFVKENDKITINNDNNNSGNLVDMFSQYKELILICLIGIILIFMLDYFLNMR